MEREEIKKLVRKEFKDIREDCGFAHRTGTVLIRLVPGEVLHVIAFEFGSPGFTCSVAILPLFMLDVHAFYLAMGGRLSRFKDIRPREWWDRESAGEGLREIKERLQRNALPYFDRYGTPEGIIEFITLHKFREYHRLNLSESLQEEYLMLNFSESFQKQYLGFSQLYVGRVAEGLQSLTEMTDGIGERANDSVKHYKEHVLALIATIRQDPGKTPEILQGFVVENKTALKLLDWPVWRGRPNTPSQNGAAGPTPWIVAS